MPRTIHRTGRSRLIAFAVYALCGGALILRAATSWPDSPAATIAQVPAAEPSGAEGPAPGASQSSWFNPATAPFIPVPLIGVDPNSGTTLGLIPTWVHTDDQQHISRIIAPDVVHNPYFGYGAHFRDYSYPSDDNQWSVVADLYEHVQRGVDFEYQHGRLRDQRWSINASLIDDRDGTPRFYGIGNESQTINVTDYTQQQERAQVQIGLNLSHALQLQYTGREQVMDVLPGTLANVVSLQSRFGHILGVGTNDQMLNRVSVIYDTRDDVTIPRQGMELVAYGGLASRRGALNDSMYSEAGFDGRAFWSVRTDTIVATHLALRYLPSTEQVPFWALSSVGGGQSEIGGGQPLRGYGAGRFYDRDSFSSSIELRHKVVSFDAMSTRVDVELTPFVDLGRVFARAGTFPLEQLHQVYGIGFRGIAAPFVVGYVDIGFGSSGVAAFTGINYPF